jgi:hypothetical protein
MNPYHVDPDSNYGDMLYPQVGLFEMSANAWIAFHLALGKCNSLQNLPHKQLSFPETTSHKS